MLTMILNNSLTRIVLLKEKCRTIMYNASRNILENQQCTVVEQQTSQGGRVIMAVLSSTAQFTSMPYNHQLSGLDTASSIKKEQSQ